MTTFDLLGPSLRRAALRWPDANNLRIRYEEMRTAYDAGSDAVLEHCKAIIETVCHTILEEMGAGPPENDDLTAYVIAARSALGIDNTRGASRFDSVLSAHNRLTDAIKEVRNVEGAVAHGKDGFLDRMSVYHARTYVLAADTVVGLLVEAFDGVQPSLRHTRDPHERFEHLNARINDRVAIEAVSDDEDGTVVLTVRAGGGLDPFELRFSPSRLLYDLDREAYVEVLDALREAPQEPAAEREEEIEEAVAAAGVEAVPAVEPERAHPEPSRLPTRDLRSYLERQNSYEGKYAPQIQAFFDTLLHTHHLDRHLSNEDLQALTCTLLHAFEGLETVDWNTHRSTRSRMQIVVGRILRSFALPEERTGELRVAIVEWFAANFGDQSP